MKKVKEKLKIEEILKKLKTITSTHPLTVYRLAAEEVLDTFDDYEEITLLAVEAVIKRLDDYEDIEDYFSYLDNPRYTHNSTLCDYTDTHAFFDAHYDEIQDIRIEKEEDIGYPLKVEGDLKNFYAWVAFKESTRRLGLELGITD